jgi:hypothetical protein
MKQFHVRIVRTPRWQIALVGAAIFAIVAALFLVAFGVFLLALPVFLVLGALAYLFGGGQPINPRPETDRRTIDGDYRVIGEKRVKRHDR